jgi:ABC-type branched-subunit amino acid transport system substrate-binding protein
VTEAGGKVLGGAVHPLLSRTDFSKVLRQAQQSGAKVLALTSFTDDLANTLKQARAMNMHKAMRFAALLMEASDAHDIGLETTQGLLLTTTFYWDLNERTRAFMDRIRLKAPKAYPGQAWVRGGEADGRNFANISIVYNGQIRGVCLSRGRCRRRFLDQEDLLRH